MIIWKKKTYTHSMAVSISSFSKFKKYQGELPGKWVNYCFLWFCFACCEIPENRRSEIWTYFNER